MGSRLDRKETRITGTISLALDKRKTSSGKNGTWYLECKMLEEGRGEQADGDLFIHFSLDVPTNY